tara:strand:+ start:107 stop:916 length:810 start_codon:yes stop_codon:yes gene_type:complete
MGIFRDITKSLKKAAPIIGAGIGMYFGGPMGASIGSGIGSLASGRSTEEALKNAALAGASTYAMGGKDFGKGFEFDTSGSPLRTMFQGASTAVDAGAGQVDMVPSSSGGISSFFDKIIPNSTLGKIAVGSTALGLLGGSGGESETTANKMREYSKGEYRGGKLTTLDDNGNPVDFDGGDPEQVKAYREQLARNQRRKKQVVTDYDEYGIFNAGGEVNGPGTGTSDSVPARLSDGEFVVTAQAVRGAGGGDRDVGAARMYDMMSQLERAA